MVYVPEIANYKPFYIQIGSDSVARDTAEWGLVAKTNPYPLLPTPKEPYKNEWNDENGDDEYVDALHYESLEFSVTFYIKAYDDGNDSSTSKIYRQVRSFFESIKGGYFMTYDSYSGIGFQQVRYAGYKEESFISRSNWSRAIFTITFKANDPTTSVTLNTDGALETI